MTDKTSLHTHKSLATAMGAALLAAVLLFAWLPGLTQGQEQAPRRGLIDVVLLIDSSPSTQETDPNNARVEAARLLISYLEAIGEVSESNVRVSVANFGGVVDEETAFSLRSLEGRDLQDAIAPTDILNTDFRPALQYALNQFRIRQSVERADARAVILFTDGSPWPVDFDAELSDSDKALYFAGEPIDGDQSSLRMDELLKELEDIDAGVYVVSVDDKDREYWEEAIPAERFLPLGQEQASAADLSEVFIQLASELTGLEASDRLRIEDGIVEEVVLKPFLEEVILAVLKDSPIAQVTLRSPSGVTLDGPTIRATGDDLYEIYAVAEPEEGTWQLEVQRGDANVWFSQRLPKLEVSGPKRSVALGTSAKLWSRLVRASQTVTDSDLEVVFELSGPNDTLDRLAS